MYRSSLYLVFTHKAFEPVVLLLCWGKVIFLQAFRHIVDELTLLRTDTGAAYVDSINNCYEFLYLLAQDSELGWWQSIMSFGGAGGLPLLIGNNVAVPGTYTSQFVSTFVQIMTGMTTHPFKGRRCLATLEPGTI